MISEGISESDNVEAEDEAVEMQSQPTTYRLRECIGDLLRLVTGRGVSYSNHFYRSHR